MSPATLRCPAVHDASVAPVWTTRPAPSAAPAVRGDRTMARFLIGVSVTLLPLLAAVVALQLGWSRFGATTWPAAAAVVTGWALAGTGWLWCRGWPAGAVLTVIGAPVVVLAGPAALGWLSPAGLVLWGPVTTVLAVAVAIPVQPLTPSGPPSATAPAHD
ncbi:hypothetical protein ACI784_04895 [Geodermatophilus sp. SYSU D01186]